MQGIDVSENNGFVDWKVLKQEGIEFAIIRLGYGRQHLDSRFYENVNGCLQNEIPLGIYYYSYALDEDEAQAEADYVDYILETSGLKEKITKGIWYDMEDSDGYKARRGVTDSQEITNLCSVFINALWRKNYATVGLYANYDWLTNKIYVDQLGGCAIWAAQYNSTCDYEHADMWQYTDSFNIGGNIFDGNILYEKEG